jgi:fructose-1,6-bisphosphatase II
MPNVIAVIAVSPRGSMYDPTAVYSEERDRALDAGHDLDRALTTDDLVSSEDAFFAATGIDGELLRGVHYRSGGASTHSLVMRARSGTIRHIHSEHALWKVSRYSVVPY